MNLRQVHRLLPWSMLWFLGIIRSIHQTKKSIQWLVVCFLSLLFFVVEDWVWLQTTHRWHSIFLYGKYFPKRRASAETGSPPLVQR